MLKKYNILIPPIDKNILDLTSFEADAFFKWYINHIDQRVEYLPYQHSFIFSVRLSSRMFCKARLMNTIIAKPLLHLIKSHRVFFSQHQLPYLLLFFL